MIENIIRNRRSIYPYMFTDEIIDDEKIWEILESARWAPTHKHTEPWMFKVFSGDSRKKLGEFLAEAYKNTTPEDKFLERKFKKALKNPLKSSHIIAICMQRNEDSGIPEWEEIASVAMAVQNMWLTCSGNKIGCYWSSPKSIVEDKELLQLKKDQRCLGLFYIGIPKEAMRLEGERTEIKEKVEWLDAKQ